MADPRIPEIAITIYVTNMILTPDKSICYGVDYSAAKEITEMYYFNDKHASKLCILKSDAPSWQN